MADYYYFQQVVQICGFPEATLWDLQQKGLLEPTVKRGRSFLSSQQVYRLRVAVRHARKDKIDLLEALKKSGSSMACSDYRASGSRTITGTCKHLLPGEHSQIGALATCMLIGWGCPILDGFRCFACRVCNYSQPASRG